MSMPTTLPSISFWTIAPLFLPIISCRLSTWQVTVTPWFTSAFIAHSSFSSAQVSAYHEMTFRGEKHLIRPLLVTGLKCWHLRPSSTFYPKANFYHIVPTGTCLCLLVSSLLAPQGSHIIMQFGEIDCREGLVLSVARMIYETIEEVPLSSLSFHFSSSRVSSFPFAPLLPLFLVSFVCILFFTFNEPLGS